MFLKGYLKKNIYNIEFGRVGKCLQLRAFYGHSIPMKILKEETMPPDVLYHGTARRFLQSINQYGLLPRNRQYVHLSQDIGTVDNVGKHHDN